MKTSPWTILLAVAFAAACLGGCGKGDDAGDQPKVEGKVKVIETPPGTVAPGDVRKKITNEGTDAGGR